MAVLHPVPNRVLTKHEAEDILRPHAQSFLVCVEHAWRSWKSEEYDAVRHLHTPRARANIVHDRMARFAQQYFENTEGIHVFYTRGRAMVSIQDKCVVRWKKLDKNKRARGIPTNQYVLFEAQYDFEGIPSQLTHLDVGYTLNELQTDLEGVYVTCPKQRGIYWFIDLRALARGTPGAVIEFPVKPKGPQSPTEQQPRRFKVRDDAKKKDETGGEGGDQS